MYKFIAACSAAATLAISPIAFGQSGANQPAGAGATIVGPGYYVSDIDKSLTFYRDLLGMTVRMRFGPDDRPDVVIGYGAEMSRPSIMLLSDRQQGEPRKIQHGHGYNRLAINVTDLADLKARLTAAGFQSSEIRVVHGAFLMMMATDPDGYKIELLQAHAPE